MIMQDKINSRRAFIKKAALGSFMAVAIPDILLAAMGEKSLKKIDLATGNTILFQGDSITDSGRSKSSNGFNDTRSLGSGYAMLAAAGLLEKYAPLDLKIYNKGISGNKVFQLADRWDTDCIDLKPDVLSVLIGVNDFWHKLDGNYDGTVDIYKNDFIALLKRTQEALPGVKLIIGEPYAVPGVKAVDEKWYPEFPRYQQAARDVAAMFGAPLIPYQRIYDEAQKRAPGAYWTPDGVHTTLAGAQLMAAAWLKMVK
jgi:lysophospholipase L1-like esterase